MSQDQRSILEQGMVTLLRELRVRVPLACVGGQEAQRRSQKSDYIGGSDANDAYVVTTMLIKSQMLLPRGRFTS